MVSCCDEEGVALDLPSDRTLPAFRPISEYCNLVPIPIGPSCTFCITNQLPLIYPQKASLPGMTQLHAQSRVCSPDPHAIDAASQTHPRQSHLSLWERSPGQWR